jgi:hypothetical protein
MISLFKDIDDALSVDHLEIMLAMYDLNVPLLKEILEVLKPEQKAQFFEFEKSTQAEELRAFRVANLPFVDFHHLPLPLDDTMLNKIYEYYKINTLWKAVQSMLELSQLMQVTRKNSAVQKEEYEKARAARSEEEKRPEEEQWRRIKADPVRRFYGNMNEPDKP